MKIYPGSVIKPFDNIRKKQPAGPAEKTGGPSKSDTVAFSKELQQVQGQANSLSVNTDRQTRIQEVKEQIASGSYAPDSRKVAISLLKYIAKGIGSSK